MARPPAAGVLVGSRVPHRRGDGPVITLNDVGDFRRSPQAWGWPDGIITTREATQAFPTGVGMARAGPRADHGLGGVPHRRGDGPLLRRRVAFSCRRSPQAWGWPALPLARRASSIAFPTGVGMARRARRRPPWARCVPHRRGDGPSRRHVAGHGARRSPQAWGWPDEHQRLDHPARAFPTGVGMARPSGRSRTRSRCVPHRRGDGPVMTSCTQWEHRRSPQAWGWPAQWPGQRHPAPAFPTGVGMARSAGVEPLRNRRVPHRRGDGPWPSPPVAGPDARSPQAWGWPGAPPTRMPAQQAFPTGVGMARTSRPPQRGLFRVPHRRGDGPGLKTELDSETERSPQAWGWPAAPTLLVGHEVAFPTGVGMARTASTPAASTSCVPHRRGDGPAARWPCVHSCARSPQAWGWPAHQPPGDVQGAAFPTGVGMARGLSARRRPGHGVPHRRGDGPRHIISALILSLRSPQAWGWPVAGKRPLPAPNAFPTGVGMARCRTLPARAATSVPHRRGDGPWVQVGLNHARARSPQAWGWPAPLAVWGQHLGAFPTGVGMARGCRPCRSAA